MIDSCVPTVPGFLRSWLPRQSSWLSRQGSVLPRPGSVLPLLIVLLVAPEIYCGNSVADGPADNNGENVRPIPPAGIVVNKEVREILIRRCGVIRGQIDQLIDRRDDLKSIAGEFYALPRAVEMTINFHSFYDESQVAAADEILNLCNRELKSRRLAVDGSRSWEFPNRPMKRSA